MLSHVSSDRPRLKPFRVGLELALTLAPAVGGVAVAVADDRLPLVARLGLLVAAGIVAMVAATVIAVPELHDDAIVVRIGPIRRRHPAGRMSALAVEGHRVTIIRRDGSQHPILTPARFNDPEGLRDRLRSWAEAHEVDVAS